MPIPEPLRRQLAAELRAVSEHPDCPGWHRQRLESLGARWAPGDLKDKQVMQALAQEADRWDGSFGRKLRSLLERIEDAAGVE